MNIDFDKGNGLVPAIVQDARSRAVLMLGYMNAEALAATRRSGRVTFFSRSKNRLWTKGESSGNFLQLADIRVDCDGDTLLVQAIPVGPACHTGATTCWGEPAGGNVQFLEQLEATILSRKSTNAGKSYTASLFASGINRIAQKVGEEAVEVVIAAKDAEPQALKEESADLLYHLLVLLAEKNVALGDVVDVLQRRSGAKAVAADAGVQ